jgi:hypothetical protein
VQPVLEVLQAQHADNFGGALARCAWHRDIAEHVLGLESRFKLAHFKLLIAIKNALTEEQIAMIDKGIKHMREQMKP